MSYISVHEHCRDWEQSSIATIGSVFKLAKRYGFEAIADMPNTKPKMDTLELAMKRVRTAADQGVTKGYYFHMGISNDPEKINQSVEAVRNIPNCIGIKMYAGGSTNEFGIPEESQLSLYHELVANDYRGVLTVHCEKESLFNKPLTEQPDWNPNDLHMWNDYRDEFAEVASVRDQLNYMKESKAKFSLHIAHASSPITVEAVKDARDRGVDVTCGITPHHLLLSTSDMSEENGMKYKVNPPLRNELAVKYLRSLLRGLDKDIIETDHAPHSKASKRCIGCDVAPSGIQSLRLYPRLIREVPSWGVKKSQIGKMTYENPKKIFNKII